MIEGQAGMWDAAFRVQEIDAEGVDQEILFPQRMFGVIRNNDYDYIQACFNAYNELVAEFCAAAPDRFHGLGLVNYWNPEATRDEVAKIKALGAEGRADAKPAAREVYFNGRRMEGLWDGIEEGGLPLSFHVGETFDARGLGGLATTIVVAFQPFRRLFSLLTFSGILEQASRAAGGVHRRRDRVGAVVSVRQRPDIRQLRVGDESAAGGEAVALLAAELFTRRSKRTRRGCGSST